MNQPASEIFALVSEDANGDERIVTLPDTETFSGNVAMFTTIPDQVALLRRVGQKVADETGKRAVIKAFTFMGDVSTYFPKPKNEQNQATH